MEVVKSAINEAIANIDEEILELNSRRNTLYNIDTLPISNAEKWCLLRETPLRGNKEGMLMLAREFIPGADNYLYDVNCVKVCMGRIIVSIPTNREQEINLFYNGVIINKYPEPEEPSRNEKFLSGYINLLENNSSTYILLKYCLPNANIFSRYLFYVFKLKKQLRNIEKVKSEYQKLVKERQKRDHERLDAYNTFANEVCRFDALLFDKVKSFANGIFEIKRNRISY